MNGIEPTYIAGSRTDLDWKALRPHLLQRLPDAWKEAHGEFFEGRLARRYLEPIALLQQNGTLSGEGFSIVAIQCSLIEFLESTRRGISFRRPTKQQPLGLHEYFVSSTLFCDFLSQRQPFSSTFNAQSAEDFYESVRCAVLHEAQTKNGWKIWADGPTDRVADTDLKRLYRNNFQAGLRRYIDTFESELLASLDLQDAFVRKFDSLCS